MRQTIKNYTMKPLFLLFIGLLSLQMTAQDGGKSKQLLDEVSHTIENYNNIILTFDYALDNDQEKIHQKTGGKIYVMGNKYHLNFMGTDRISDGNKIYNIIHEDEEVYVSDANEESNGFTPASILHFYKKGFHYTWGKLKAVEGVKVQYIKLKPIKEDDIAYIMLGIDTNTKHIHSITYHDKRNTKVSIRIRTFKPNENLSPKEFTFDNAKYKAKNYSITEL